MTELRFVAAPPPEGVRPASRHAFNVDRSTKPRTNLKRLPGQVCTMCAVRPVHARGFCHSCYRTYAPRKRCEAPGCERKRNAQGLCLSHYEQALNAGTISVKQRPGRPISERFWSYVDEPNGAGCRIWVGHAVNGHPRFTPEGGRSRQAHHVAWWLAYGAYAEVGRSMPQRLVHRCRQTLCMTAEHLELVTASEAHRRARVWRGTSDSQPDDMPWLELARVAQEARS